MSCAIKLMKFILFTINISFVIVGIVLMIAGSWAVFNMSSFLQAIAFAFGSEFTGSEMYQNVQLTEIIAYTCIGTGLLIFLISFFGCCGVVTDNYCLLITYAIVVSCLFLTKILCIVSFLILGDKISPIIYDQVLESFSVNYKGSLGFQSSSQKSAYSHTMDAIMVQFQCCGIGGKSDFKLFNNSKFWHKDGRVYVDQEGKQRLGDEVTLPVACCQFKSKDFQMNATFKQLHKHMVNPNCPLNPPVSYNKVGCIEEVSKSFHNYTVVIVVVPVIISVIEVIGVILASALSHEIKHDINQMFY